MGTTEDETVEWYHWLNGYEFEQGLEVGDGQRSLGWYSSWRHNKSDTTEWLNWTECSSIFDHNGGYMGIHICQNS